MPHIKVELDFIPVEERLPIVSGFYPALVNTADYGRRVYWDGESWCLSLGRVTHWAEIPQVSDANAT